MRFGVEAETRLRDVQVLTRKLELKRRDGDVAEVILIVSASQANRRALAEHREALLPGLPLDGHAILRALRTGLAPGGSGIVVV